MTTLWFYSVVALYYCYFFSFMTKLTGTIKWNKNILISTVMFAKSILVVSKLQGSWKHETHIKEFKSQVLIFVQHHLSKAIANLNKSDELVTNTTVASKYIPKRPRICINWNPPFQTSLLKIFKNSFLWSKSYFTTLTFRGTFTK